VAFEGGEVFAGPEDALDALADAGEVRAVGGLVLACRSQQAGAHPLDGVFEFLAGVALVGDDQFAAVQRPRQPPQRDVALLPIGGGEDRGPGCAVRGGGRVQAKAEEPAAVAAAVAAAGCV
jgi:hypothetical protein